MPPFLLPPLVFVGLVVRLIFVQSLFWETEYSPNRFRCILVSRVILRLRVGDDEYKDPLKVRKFCVSVSGK